MPHAESRLGLHTVRDAVRTQLWPIPVLGIVLALVAGVLLPRLDAGVDAGLPGWLSAVTFGGDAGAARTVLDAVASSLVTVTSLTFSLTVVTLQLASSQFSPRLLRTFTQDLFVQVTLAVFLATFTYSLTVLRAVRSQAEGSDPFVPRIAVTASYLLAIASVLALVLFLAHLTRQIRVETMLRQVRDESHATVTANLDRQDEDGRESGRVEPPAGAVVLWAWASGFLLRVDHAGLCRTARDAGVVVGLERDPGSFVVEGTPLGRVWRPDGRAPEAGVLAELRAKLAGAVHLGPERTAAQDVGYGLRQLVDVANKALSPGINDPTTAVHALGHVGSLLCELTGYRLQPTLLRDNDGQLRAVIAHPGFAHFLDLALTQPRSYGEADSQVLGQLYQLLTDVAWHARPEHQEPIQSQLRRLHETVEEQDFDDEERARLTELEAGVERALDSPLRAPS